MEDNVPLVAEIEGVRSFVCNRDRSVMRGYGGSSFRRNGVDMYSSSHVCDLCGQRVAEETVLDTDVKTARITFDGFVRTNIRNAFTHELLACTKCGGYLYNNKKKNGTRGRMCPNCKKYRDQHGENEWKAPPHVVAKGVAVPCK